MLRVNPPQPEPDLASSPWIDLLAPDDAERTKVEAATRLRVQSRAEVTEIESSSRLGRAGDVLYLSTPMTFLDNQGISRVGPLGFVLSDRTLLTLRFDDMPVFEAAEARFAALPGAAGPEAFTILLEVIVDRLADVLEMVSTDLDRISLSVFRPDQDNNPNRANLHLQTILREIGKIGARLSNIRTSLLGVQRIAAYAREAAPWLAQQAGRLQILKGDIASLTEYDTQLDNKVQFLLDATLGFISIEQNNGIKVLTVVSVVGIPPTFIASMYGMNFKWIPELQWHYGYFYALLLMILSALLPLAWFKKRGWT